MLGPLPSTNPRTMYNQWQQGLVSAPCALHVGGSRFASQGSDGSGAGASVVTKEQPCRKHSFCSPEQSPLSLNAQGKQGFIRKADPLSSQQNGEELEMKLKSAWPHSQRPTQGPYKVVAVSSPLARRPLLSPLPPLHIGSISIPDCKRRPIRGHTALKGEPPASSLTQPFMTAAAASKTLAGSPASAAASRAEPGRRLGQP